MRPLNVHIELKLFASLKAFMPENAEHFPVKSGETVNALMERLGIPPREVKLIFIDGIKAEPSVILRGGERVGIFPPVGGG